MHGILDFSMGKITFPDELVENNTQTKPPILPPQSMDKQKTQQDSQY
jgi:hypothetical protein